MIGKLIWGFLSLGIVVVVALLFLGGSVEHRAGLVPGLPEDFIELHLPIDGDIACPGSDDDPDPCHPSPIPTIDLVAARAGVAIEVPSISVAIDHVGAYSIPLGTAVLPNGVLTEATATLENDIRPDLRLIDQVIHLRVTGEDGKRRGNTWSDGWHPGTETVRVSLEFEVMMVVAPTTLEITGIVVQ